MALSTNNDIDLDDDYSSSSSSSSDVPLRGSLENIINQRSLKWIFVGGKGGVGKTTTSCSLAILLASYHLQEKVLIISTDPAHNLSDAFGQQFSSSPTKINSISNLYAMEIDPKVNLNSTIDDNNLNDNGSLSFLSELSSSIPGIDEAMSFAELIKLINSRDYSLIIFDTAPTGHTLRLLSFPTILEAALNKLDLLRNKFGGLFQNFANNNKQLNYKQLTSKLSSMKKSVEIIREIFENDDLTTFICVCIPEFLSLYETERLVQKLTKYNIDTHNIIINQVLFGDNNCYRCKQRILMQKKYLNQFYDLYPDFHLTQIPLLNKEVRNVNKLKIFSKLLLNPFKDEFNKNNFNEKVFFKQFYNDNDDDDNSNDNNNNDCKNNDKIDKDVLDID